MSTNEDVASARTSAEEHLAYALRSAKTGPEARSARVGDSRLDFFRGKDFITAMKAMPEMIDMHSVVNASERAACANDPSRAEKLLNARIAHVGGLLLHRGYVVKCERVFKDPRKGRKKLVKFPHYLQQSRDQTFTEDGFYAWMYTPPMSWSSVAVSGAFAVGVVLMCLFPLAPIWFKKVILYVCLAILGTFGVVFSVRLVVFAMVWIALGEHFWILPNLTDDEIPINELFSPPWGFDRGAKKIGMLQRLMALSVGGAAVYAFYRFAPETGGARVLTHTAHDAILDLFNLKGGPKQLGGAVNTTNATATAASNATDGMIVPEANTTASANETNATVIPSLDEILAEVGDFYDEEETTETTETKSEL